MLESVGGGVGQRGRERPSLTPGPFFFQGSLNNSPSPHLSLVGAFVAPSGACLVESGMVRHGSTPTAPGSVRHDQPFVVSPFFPGGTFLGRVRDPTNTDNRKKKPYPCCNLSSGGPRPKELQTCLLLVGFMVVTEPKSSHISRVPGCFLFFFAKRARGTGCIPHYLSISEGSTQVKQSCLRICGFLGLSTPKVLLRTGRPQNANSFDGFGRKEHGLEAGPFHPNKPRWPKEDMAQNLRVLYLCTWTLKLPITIGYHPIILGSIPFLREF